MRRIVWLPIKRTTGAETIPEGTHIPADFRGLAEKGKVTMTKTKKITKSGGLTLPMGMRADTGLLPGVPVDIEADEKGLHIRKHTLSCRFCGSVDEVKIVSDIEICRKCAEKLQEVFHE